MKYLSTLYLQSKWWISLSLPCMQFLLGGVELDQDDNIVLLDKEMASMRPGRAFLSEINDNIPRSLSSMAQMATTLEGQRKSRPLTQAQFDSLVLSMVYSAHQAWHQETREEQEAWGGVLLQLANVTVHELRGSHLFNYAWYTHCQSVWDKGVRNKSLALNLPVCINNDVCGQSFVNWLFLL